MADRICIHYGQLDQLVNQLKSLSSAMSAAESNLRAIRIPEEGGANLQVRLSSKSMSSVPYSLRSGDVNQCLRSLADGLDCLEQRADRLASATQRVREGFAQTEKDIAQLFAVQQIPEDWRNELCGQMGVPSDIRHWTNEDIKRFAGLISCGKLISEYNTTILVDGDKLLYAVGDRLFTYEQESSFSKLTETLKVTNKWGGSYTNERALGLQKAEYKPKSLKLERPRIKPKEDKEENNKKKIDGMMSLLTVGGSTSHSASVLQKELDLEYDKGSVKASGRLFNFDAGASWKAGLYSYRVTEDGKTERVLAPGLSVKGGVSVSLLETEVSSEYELIDNIKINASVNATAGKAALDGSLNVGYVDGEWVANLDTSAELIAGEIGGSVGFDAFGVSGEMDVKVNYGIGAHFKAGYADGKITVDCGATVGVGGSVAFTLDVGDAVDKAVDFGKNLLEDIGNCFRGRSKSVLW